MFCTLNDAYISTCLCKKIFALCEKWISHIVSFYATNYSRSPVTVLTETDHIMKIILDIDRFKADDIQMRLYGFLSLGLFGFRM